MAMLRRFAREKKEMHKLNPTNSIQLLHSDVLLGDLTSDPAMMSLLTSANESELQDLLNDLEFSALDTAPQTQLAENGLMYAGAGLRTVGRTCLNQGVGVVCPPPLPEGLPAPLAKRIEDLRVVSLSWDVCFCSVLNHKQFVLILFYVLMFYYLCNSRRPGSLMRRAGRSSSLWT